ncbi:MAG: hypothetical protein IPH22_03960 [Nitrosomonas sp.]|nr:hypothetical protein [Nitrosomonas sp.]
MLNLTACRWLKRNERQRLDEALSSMSPQQRPVTCQKSYANIWHQPDQALSTQNALDEWVKKKTLLQMSTCSSNSLKLILTHRTSIHNLFRF